jgi:hypothetical protein
VRAVKQYTIFTEHRVSYFQALIIGIGLLLATLLTMVGMVACLAPIVVIWAVSREVSVPAPPVAWTLADFAPFSIPWMLSFLLGVLVGLPLILRWWLLFRFPGFNLIVRRAAVPDEASRPKYFDTLQMAVVHSMLGYPLGWLLSPIHFSNESLTITLGITQIVVTACVQAFVVVKFPYYRGFRIEVVPRRPVASATAPLVS